MGEPVENFNNGNEAEAKAKSAEAAKPRDEIQPSHLRRSLEFDMLLVYTLAMKYKPNTIESPKKIFTIAISFS